MKKLLIISDMFPDKYIPNGEVFIQKQVRELAKSFDIQVIATRLKHKLSIERENHGDYHITYVYIPYIKYVYLTLIFTYRIYAFPIIKDMIREWKPDIIHVHDFKHIPELVQLHFLLKRYAIPKFLTVHDMTTHPTMIRSKCFNWFYGITFRIAYKGWNHIFTVNEKLKETISREARVVKISNVGNAVDHAPEITNEQIEPYKKILKKNCFKIISVGNLREAKGFDILIDSVSTLIKKGHSVQLVIVGKGIEKERLISHIIELGISDYVYLTGDISNDTVRNLYPLFDAFALASYCETFGVVYIEAMYSGIPAIGVIGQGIDGVIKDGENGLLVKPKDALDLAEKIEFLINNKDQARKIAASGQDLIRSKYQLGQLINKVISYYEQ